MKLDQKGIVTDEFKHQADAFRSWVTADNSSPFQLARDRYHLYISLACPWASRTFIGLKLKGLEQSVGVTVVDPIRDDRGWAFRDGPVFSRDPINNFRFLSELIWPLTRDIPAALVCLSFGINRPAESSTIQRMTFVGCLMAYSALLETAPSICFQPTSRRNRTVSAFSFLKT